MADEATIAAVKANIADNPGDAWSDAAIEALLDSGLSVTKVTLQFWASRVAKYSTAIDVSENGSSRSLSTLFQQAKEAYDMWLQRSKDEENPEVPNRFRVAFHKAKRV